MRKRQGHEGDWVLGVVYKGRATHHLIVKEPDGMFYINKKKFGNNSNIEDVSPRVCVGGGHRNS